MMLPFKLNAPFAKVALSTFGILSALALSSCQDEDYGFTQKEISDSVYDRNFIAKFGEISPDQSWDLSKYAEQKTKTVGTRAMMAGDSFESGSLPTGMEIEPQSKWVTVPNSMVTILKEQLVEAENNLKADKANVTTTFQLTVKEPEDLIIIPMYQGASGLICDLHMVIDGTVDKVIWDKSSGIQKMTSNTIGWKNLNKMDLWRDQSKGNQYGNTTDADAIQAQPIKISGIPQGSVLTFYLHVNQGHLQDRQFGEFDHNSSGHSEANLSFTGVKQWSTEGKMCVLNKNLFEIPQSLKDEFGAAEAMLIGCEDALSKNLDSQKTDIKIYTDHSNYYTYNSQTGDFLGITKEPYKIDNWDGDDDLNDLVFLVLSKTLPDANGDSHVEKRYLFEDMGSVVDWDFNDVVVDFYQDVVEGNKTQSAVLRHRCGTTPFQITVGEKVLNFGMNSSEIESTSGSTHYIKGYVQDDPNVTIDLTALGNPWNPETNNVSISVIPLDVYKTKVPEGSKDNWVGSAVWGDDPDDDNGMNFATFDAKWALSHAEAKSFPQPGDVPRIIAVDTDFAWTAESTDIEKSAWQKYDVNITVSPSGAGYVKGAGNFFNGRKTKLVAVANDGYKFSHYEINSQRFDASEGNYELTVNGAKNVVAVYAESTSESPACTVSVSVEGTGKVQSASSSSGSYSDASGSISVDAGKNVYLQPVATAPWAFYEWQSTGSKVDKSEQIILGGGDVSVKAVFKRKFDLTLQLSDIDKSTEYSKVSFTLNGETKNCDNDGKVVFSVFEGDPIVVTAKSSRVGDGEWNAFFAYSYNSSVEEEKVHNTKASTKLGNMPSNDKTFIVDVTYQIKAYVGYKEGSSNKEDATRGKVEVFVGDVSTGTNNPYLHYNTQNISIVATETNSDYKFTGWSDGKTTATISGLQNNADNGCIFIYAYFNRSHQLNIDLDDASLISSIKVNGKDMTINGNRASASVEEGAAMKLTVAFKDVSGTYDAKLALAGKSIDVWNGQESSSIGTMGSSDQTISAQATYQVRAYTRLGTVSGGSLTIDTSKEVSEAGTVTLNGGSQTQWIAKTSVTKLKAVANSGYVFKGWYQGDALKSENAEFEPTRDKTYYVDAVFVEASTDPTLTFNINNNDKGYINAISVNDTPLTITDGVATTQIAAGTALSVTIGHQGISGKYDVTYNVSTGTAGYSNGFVLNNDATSFGTMPSSNLTFDIQAKYQVQAAINGAWNDANDGMGSVAVHYGNNQTADKQVWLPYGSTFEFVATPKENYVFVGAKDNKALSGIVGHARYGIDALFEGKTLVNVTAKPNGAGTVKINNGTAAQNVQQRFVPGDEITLTASLPANGYAFTGWSSGDYTYSRIITVPNQDQINPDANYVSGVTIFDITGATPTEVGGNYGKLQTDMSKVKSALSGKSSAKVVIYTPKSYSGRTVHLMRTNNSGEWKEMSDTSGDSSNKYTNISSDGNVTFELSSEAITNLLNSTQNFYIQNNTDASDKLEIYRVNIVF